MQTIRHIFSGEINDYFAEKLHSFHDNYVETMLLCGVDKPGTPLDKIKMTKNPSFTMQYYKKVVGGLLKFQPEVYVSCIDELGTILAECTFTYLNDKKHVNSIFLLQNVYNWDSTSLSCAQVWRIKEPSTLGASEIAENMCNINRYWHD